MTESHPELTAELRRLAQTLLDTLDPAVRMAAARAASGSPGKCEQVWCPVCAVAALVSGEQHPLLTVVAEHSVSLLAVVRAMTEGLEETVRTPADPPGAPSSPEPEPARPRPGHYQHIPIDVDE